MLHAMFPFALALTVATATTATDHDGDAKRRVLVADAVANGVDPNLAKTLTSMLVTRLSARPGVDALSGAELRKLMSLQADKAACGDDSCVDDLSGALGAPLALFSDVGKLGALTEVNLTLFDTTKNEPVARAAAEAQKVEELSPKLDAAIDQLLAQAPPPSTASTAAATPSAPTAPAKIAAAPKAKALTVADPDVKAEVQKVISAHKSDLKECGDIARSKHVHGVVRVRSLVASDGKVTFARVAGTDMAGSGVPKCVIDKVATWTFPASGAPETIVYPIHFK
jgi:hypothetical protein